MLRVKTIDRYIIRTFLKLFALSLVSLLLMRMAIDMLTQMDEFTESFDKIKDYTAWTMVGDMLRYYFFQLFVYVTQLGGVIIVAAAAFTIGWMNHSNELTAMLASGMSLHRVVLPIIIASMLVGLMIIVDQEVIIPNPTVRQALIQDPDEAGGERDQLNIRFLIDGEMSVWYASEYEPGNDRTGESARLGYPMIILRDREFRYISHIVGRESYPLFEPERNRDFEGQTGWMIYDGEINRLESGGREPWRHTQKTDAIYTHIGPHRFFQTARRANPDLGQPQAGQRAEIRKPSPQIDEHFNMRIRAYKFVSGPLTEVVDPQTNRTSLQFVDGELERPRFDFLSDDGRVLATVFADRATWVPGPLHRCHWKLEGGSLFYPSDLSPDEMELQVSGSYLEYLSSGELTQLLTAKRTIDASAVRMTKYIRFVEPLNNLVLLLLVLPFILSRERNLKFSALLAVFIGAAFFIFVYMCRYMDMGDFWSAFLPVLLFGPIAVLMLDSVKT